MPGPSFHPAIDSASASMTTCARSASLATASSTATSSLAVPSPAAPLLTPVLPAGDAPDAPDAPGAPDATAGPRRLPARRRLARQLLGLTGLAAAAVLPPGRGLANPGDRPIGAEATTTPATAAAPAPPAPSARLKPPATPAATMPLIPVTRRAGFVQGFTEMGSSANANFISNAGFVETRDSLVVIDALGSPPLGQQFLDQLRAERGKSVSHVIVTHYHADHIYGLQAFKDAGATIIAHRKGIDYLNSDTARLRLDQSRIDLWPWVDETTRLVAADRWIDDRTRLEIGGVEFDLLPVGPSHTAEDLAIHVASERLLFCGDLVFAGRIPYIGQADSRHWISALEALLDIDVDFLVPGHGPQSRQPREHIELTRDYLVHLRAAMGEAARNLEPFDEAYQRADWSRFSGLPLFEAVNRMNAYNTFLLMEQER